MKKSYFWFGQVIVLTAANAAHAQSSVTLYGLIDTGINYTNSAQTGKAANGAPGAYVHLAFLGVLWHLTCEEAGTSANDCSV
jgi:predicted porin